VLQNRDENNPDTDAGRKDPSKHQWHDHAWHGTLADAGATILGAVIIGASIAPTDEIPMIASTLSSPWLLALIASSLLISYIIVFEASFGAQTMRWSQPGLFQSPISETLASYLIALLTSFLMLWLFQLLRAEDPLSQWVSYTIILGLPATIGGAAGRLAL
jgi:putative integral membrane protein (TIGR02587 family)